MGNIKKLRKNEWEIPKEGKMNVPCRIFASEKLLEKMKQDRTLEQGKNVSFLPGIYKYSIILPDGHEGYGFPIGGVAALDYEKGGISPGGIGYDINCLTEDAKILTEFGASKKIEEFDYLKSELEFEQNGQLIKKLTFLDKLPSLNMNSKCIENKAIMLFMSKESSDVYEIKLNSGLKIKATEDHPFLTKKEMIPLAKLNCSDEIAVNLFEGIHFNKNIERKKAIIAKVLGYMFGDGTLYESSGRLFAAAYGSKEDLEKMQEDLLSIKVNSKIYSRQRRHSINTKYGKKDFETLNHELHIHSQDFCKILKKLGMPLGKKTRQK
ncbi:hypothetical protein DRN69_02730, partial [Candidatus Pacearchaeota archaeon]